MAPPPAAYAQKQPKKGAGKTIGIIAAVVVIAALIVALVVVVVLPLLDSPPATEAGNNTSSSNNGSSSTPADIDAILSGEVVGQVGQQYQTKWFKFTVNSLTTASTYENTSSAQGSYSAGSGNILVIANITITNTFTSTQPFGTYDWHVYDSTLPDRIWPLSPLSAAMMPDDFDLDVNKTVTYDVVIEIPANLPNPSFTYVEVDEEGGVHTTFKIPIK